MHGGELVVDRFGQKGESGSRGRGQLGHFRPPRLQLLCVLGESHEGKLGTAAEKDDAYDS